jgi:hypothetical protein
MDEHSLHPRDHYRWYSNSGTAISSGNILAHRGSQSFVEKQFRRRTEHGVMQWDSAQSRISHEGITLGWRICLSQFQIQKRQAKVLSGLAMTKPE